MSQFAFTNDDAQQDAVPVSPGIHDNVSFRGFDFRSLTDGNDPVLIADFELETGSVFSGIIWTVDEARERASAPNRVHPRTVKTKGYVKGEPMTGDEAVAIAYDNFRQKVMHIANRFIEQEAVIEATQNVSSYAQFATALKNLFTEEILSNCPKVRMKISPNSKGYATLPTYPPFLEPMSVTASSLKFNSYEQGLFSQNTASEMNGEEEVPF